MNKTVATLLLLGVAAISYWAGRETVPPSDRTPVPVTERGGAAVPAKVPPQDSPALGGAPKSVAGEADALFQAYKCPDSDATRCEYAPLAAVSPAEAQWLARMGYPTPPRAEALNNLPLSELKRLSDANDIVARVFYGKKLVEAGQGLIGLGVMQQAAVRGSVYANIAMAELLMDKNSGVADPVEGKARLRLAYLLGDWKTSYAMSSALDRYSAPVETGVVDRRAMRLYEGLLSAKFREKAPVVISVRPTSADPL